jgi:CRP-like cAMP-binding protein/Pyruvate/2-oxoacid:ferredoxin oxidoreductase delta subunit
VIQLTIDGVSATVPEGTTIFDAAGGLGITIPTLCHQKDETPVGVCRLCVVESGGRTLTASCVRAAEEGMTVSTNSERVLKSRRMLLELLMADHPSPCVRERQSGDCELEALARGERIEYSRFATNRAPRGRDDSSLSIAVDHQACILCDRCIRGCNEIRNNHVLGRTGKGYNTGIGFDLDVPMGSSTCVSCGECMISCPTGALTNRQVVEAVLPHGEPAEADDLKRLHYFEEVSGTFLELNKNAIVKRHFRAGEIVCREGEYGSTAFYILEGKAKVFLASPMAHVKTGGSAGFVKKLGSRLAARGQDRREGENDRRSIPIDGPVDLPYDNPVAEFGPGDLFGEMTCMSQYPRSATVQAATDCTMYEMLRNVLDIMLRNPALKAKIDANYRRRALENHLKSVPIFAPLSAEFIDSLRDRVELVRYNAGEVICRQGDVADAFYLVRVGFVKVSEEHASDELILAYLGRGGYFGEIGLLGEGVRTATCTALDQVELVRIHAHDFHRMMASFPDVRSSLDAVARQHLEQNRQRVTKSAAVPLAQFLDRGLMEAQSLLIIDLAKCTRCDDCVRACASAHDGVTRLIREGLRFDQYLVATSCRQCRDPLCMVGCPVGAIRRRNSLEVIIEDWCIGCGLCANNCPYGNINMHPFEGTAEGRAAIQQKATSCDLCADHAEPACVYACAHDAAHRVEPNQFFGSLVRPGNG